MITHYALRNITQLPPNRRAMHLPSASGKGQVNLTVEVALSILKRRNLTLSIFLLANISFSLKNLLERENLFLSEILFSMMT